MLGSTTRCEVCDGRTYPNAATYDPAVAGVHPTAIAVNWNSGGSGDRWGPQPDNRWVPKALAEAQVVACIN